jgi:ribosomal protein S18 acetylase RimI-like enzyme
MTSIETDIAIRPMVPSDIARVAALQVAFLEGSILTELGPRFLTRFHTAALDLHSTRAFVAAGSGADLAGFVVGSIDVDAFNHHVKPRILLPLAGSLLPPRRWRLMWSVARGLTEAEPQPHVPAELLLLVVDSRVRRRGIGLQLLSALEASFAAGHVSRYRVAVRSHLAVARLFYRASGFELEQELTVLGHPMTYLTKRIAT